MKLTKSETDQQKMEGLELLNGGMMDDGDGYQREMEANNMFPILTALATDPASSFELVLAHTARSTRHTTAHSTNYTAALLSPHILTFVISGKASHDCDRRSDDVPGKNISRVQP